MVVAVGLRRGLHSAHRQPPQRTRAIAFRFLPASPYVPCLAVVETYVQSRHVASESLHGLPRDAWRLCLVPVITWPRTSPLRSGRSGRRVGPAWLPDE